MKEKQLFRFGEFRLYLDERSLRRGDENIPLTPKMYDLLVVLVENHDRILDKEFLLQSVWPDSFVEEGNITFNIRQLRKALGDDAQSPMYIETVPRRGYRFVADVEQVSAAHSPRDGGAKAVISAPKIAEPHSQRYVLLAAGAFIILTGALVLGAWLIRSSRAGAAPVLSAPFASEKLSTDGLVTHAAISPDGKNVVYTHRNGAKQSLWLRQLDTSNSIQIIPPSEYFYGGLAISADGTLVYFARGGHQAPGLAIYRIPIFGGVPEKITEGTQGWISVSRDGQKISFVRCPYTDDDYCSLYVADAADGKNEKRLATRPRPIRMADNEIAPDGKTIAFAVGQSRTASNDFRLAEVDIETGAERYVTAEQFFNINYIAWLPDQSSLLITALKIPDKHYRIWQINSSTGETAKLTADSQTYSRLGLDARASVLLSTTVEPDYHLNIYQTDHPDTEPLVLSDASTVTFAPNGRVIFSSVMTGNTEIWSINADGSDQHQLTNSPADEMTPVVSPDDRVVYFESNRSGAIHIWQMAPDGTDQKQLTTEEGGYPTRISPDGRWLYYGSPLSSTIRRVATDSGREELIMKEPGWYATISPDTTLVAYLERNNENMLSVMSMADHSVVKRFKLPETGMTQLIWSADGKDLAYILSDNDNQKARLWFQPLSGEPPRLIADLGGDDIGEIAALALAPDGRSFAVIKGKWKHNAVLLKGLK